MACASLMDVEDFTCVICLNTFDKPVAIPCGHNFCLKCISDFWDRGNAKCPVCNHVFENRPVLTVNTFIAEMVRKIQNQQASAAQECVDGSVPCSICAGGLCPAVKSCLVCFMSYCETHLEPHRRKPILRKHKLIAPVKDLESRICDLHQVPFDLFCQQDKMFVCEFCKNTDLHTKHTFVTLEEEAHAQMNHLRNERGTVCEMLEKSRRMLCEVQNSVAMQRHMAEREQSESMMVMSSLMDYIKKSLAELMIVTETNLTEAEKMANGVTAELEAEIEQMNKKKQQLDEVLIEGDNFTFLENVLRGTIKPVEVKDWSAVGIHADLPSVQGVVNMLKTTILKEIQVLCDPDLREMQRHAVILTLDPDTAGPSLQVSADGKKVWMGNMRFEPNNGPKRFTGVQNILAKEEFSGGKFYYETQVKDKTHWLLGVVNQSINRKGDIRLNPDNGYWTLVLKNGDELIGNDGTAIKLHVRRIPNKVGVFVDYKEGQVSFYDVEIRSQIFSFTGCGFKEPLYPIFSPGSANRGKNVAPLIITDHKK